MMETGDSRSVEIIARRPRNATGFRLTAGETYRFEAAGTWRDFRKPCGPSGYASRGWMIYMRLFERLRHVPDAAWFALIGELEGAPASRFVIGTGCEYRAAHTGELACFANDVKRFYFNNSGCVTLTVTRLT